MPKLEEVDYNPFEVEGKKLIPVDGNPFEQAASQMPQVELAQAHESIPVPPQWKSNLSNFARPMLEGGGASVGGIIGAGAGAPTGPGAIATAILGSSLGYSIGKKSADALDQALGLRGAPTLEEQSIGTLKDIGTGAFIQGMGMTAVPVAKSIVSGAGKVIKPILGRMSGVGTGAIDEAIKSGAKANVLSNPLANNTAFDKALRGKITGEEVVENAKSAVMALKESRSSAYQQTLKTITKNSKPININPIKRSLNGLMGKYNVQVANGKIDTSRIAMGKTGRKDIEEIIDIVSDWGNKPGDNTVEGLDVLKRQLDDFYSDSSQARQFVISLKNSVKDTITKAVPEYERLTGGYSDATKLIKDIESGLMLRKQGISGRIVADQTLRRLMSSMRDNFALRRELVEVLGDKSGIDLLGQTAGYAMSSPIPSGLAGTGPVIAGQMAYAQFVNPSFWPVIAASSPRVQGEFLRLFGRSFGIANKIPEKIMTESIKQAMINAERSRKEKDK